jgi:hypothetical protein
MENHSLLTFGYTKWYKYTIASPEIELSVDGKKVRGEATPVLNDQKLRDVIDRFRSKYGELERYYNKLDTAIAMTI